MSRCRTFDRTDWTAACSADEQCAAESALEDGEVLLFSRLAFAVDDGERQFFDPQLIRGRSKNVSFDAATGTLRGVPSAQRNDASLRAFVARYADRAKALIELLFPRYRPQLIPARTSFRPVDAATRTTSWRKDDTRLHIDAFPSSPTGGMRILRVFSNVDPLGRDRVWRVGETFVDAARRFFPTVGRPLPGSAALLLRLGVTRGLRSRYDHMMLGLHDRMKADLDYQAGCRFEELRFPPGSTWIACTDAVSHAAIAGQFMLERTFLLPVGVMRDPERSPLRILERLAGRRLA